MAIDQNRGTEVAMHASEKPPQRPVVRLVEGFDPAQGGTTSYFADPGKAALNNLARLDPLRGYWVHASGSTTLNVQTTSGQPVPVPLTPGWNLVSWGGADGAPLPDAIASLSPDAVYGFNPSGDGTTSWFSDQNKLSLTNLHTLQTNQAYWVHVTASSLSWTGR